MHRAIVLLLAARLVVGQDGITVTPPNGQTSRVSITSELEYKTQRSCVAHCLYYNGGFVRGPYHHDWDDVGGELGCGWAPINACYCNTKYASSATAYFSTCVPYYCGSGDNADPDNLVSALSLYNSYCAAANGNPTKPVPVPVTIPATTTSQSSEEMPSETSEPGNTSTPVDEPTQPVTTGSSRASSAVEGAATAEQKTSPSPTDAASTGGSGGLSKGATIGIAVGASVGGIALIAAAVVLFLSRRKSALAGGKEPMGGIEG
ncbi:hypothetical protein TWF281_011067 [Arthrobotrys megalospora]